MNYQLSGLDKLLIFGMILTSMIVLLFCLVQARHSSMASMVRKTEDLMLLRPGHEGTTIENEGEQPPFPWECLGVI